MPADQMIEVPRAQAASPQQLDRIETLLLRRNEPVIVGKITPHRPTAVPPRTLIRQKSDRSSILVQDGDLDVLPYSTHGLRKLRPKIRTS